MTDDETRQVYALASMYLGLRFERDRLEAENAKLREFANTMRVTIKDACGVCDEVYCSSYDEEQECCMFDSIARSLGIEVEE